MFTDQIFEQLMHRAIDPELAAKLGWTSATRLGANTLAIPYVLNGEIVNHKYRTLGKEKKFAQDIDAKKCFWNIDVLKDDSLASAPLLITEGELDAISAIQCGWARTISVPDGAPAQPLGGAETAKYDYLPEALELIKPCREIIIAADGDPAGANLLHDLALRLGKARCKFLTYPLDRGGHRLKDLNGVLMEYGAKGVTETLARASWMAIPGVYRLDQLPPMPEQPVLEFGFGREIDDLMKPRRGDFWVITGAPGHGKSSFITDAICRLCEAHQLKIAWASFENDPRGDLRRSLRKWHIATQRMADDQLTNWTWADYEIAAADSWINKHFVFLLPDDDTDATVSWLMDTAEAAVIREGCDAVIVDPWNEMDHVRPADTTLTEYVGIAIKAMKRRAKVLQVWWCVIAHPAKMRHDEDIGLYSISDSAHWANKPDIGVIIHRPDDDGTAELRVAKARYEEIGKRGTAKMRFDATTRRFSPVPR